MLKASQFNVVHVLADGRAKVVNTLWRSVVELPAAAAEQLDARTEQRFCEARVPGGTVDTLRDCGMLVDVAIDEFDAFKEQFRSWTRSNKVFSVTFAPTFRCNFSCVYCVQEPNFSTGKHDLSIGSNEAPCANIEPSVLAKVERKIAANGRTLIPVASGDARRPRNRVPGTDTRTIEQIVRWLGSALVSRGYASLAVNLFGGEPLLEYKRCLEFMTLTNQRSESLGLPASYQIVTNGYLLTPARAQQLHALGLAEAQITIDGLRDNHNRRRSAGRETYDRIWDHVVQACEAGIKVLLLTVIDGENVGDLRGHIDVAAELVATNPSVGSNLELQFGELFETSTTFDRTERVLLSQVNRVTAKRFEAYEYASSRGVATNNPFLVNACARESEDSILIGPDGALYKCYSTIGDRRHQIGTVFDDPLEILDGPARRIAQVRPFATHPDCRQCDIVPYCRSGCQFVASLYSDGRYGAVLCEYDTLKGGILKMLDHDVV